MSKPAPPRPLRGNNAGYALAVAAPLIWATTSILIKYLLDLGVPRLALAFWRDAIIALACLAGLIVLRPRALRVSRHDMRGFALTGAISVGVYHALWVTSIALNGAAVATVLIYTFPTFVTIGAWLLFREPIRRPQIAALALALIGCALVVRAYDPVAMDNARALVPESVTFSDSAYAAAEGADAVALITEWNEFKYLNLERLRGLLRRPLIFDGRNLWEPERMRRLGFEYYSIGRKPVLSA